MTTSNRTKIKCMLMLFASLLCAAVCGAFRFLIITTEYDHTEGLYPGGGNTDMLYAVIVASTLLLICLGAMFGSKSTEYTIKDGTPLTLFANTFAGLGFLALAFSIFLSAKAVGVGLGRLDAVLVVLALVCSVSFLLEAFSREGAITGDALHIMMLSRPICCLFISFYFYFDSSTVIHNSNKKIATLFFTAALLSLLYLVKIRITDSRIWSFMSFSAISVCFGITYFVPNLIWYFTEGEPMFLGIVFDIVCVAVCVLISAYMLSVRVVEKDGDVKEKSGADALEADAVESEEFTEAVPEEVNNAVSDAGSDTVEEEK